MSARTKQSDPDQVTRGCSFPRAAKTQQFFTRTHRQKLQYYCVCDTQTLPALQVYNKYL